jgi:hypothetical protein
MTDWAAAGHLTDPVWVVEYLPRVLPVGWEVLEDGLDGRKYAHRTRRLSVILSGAVELDGRRWLHLSVASPDGIPAYRCLCDMKRLFLGDRKALQIFPPKVEHVNIHPNCLHLWACLDADPLPDFTRGSGSL